MTYTWRRDDYVDFEAERQAIESEAFEDWCEEWGYDPEDPDTEQRWVEFQREEFEMRAESLAERQFEESFYMGDVD